jgi:glutathione S-transferase
MPSRRHRLVTLVFSHYNEKARWALDVCGVPYEERAFMPGFSQLAVLAATRGRGGRPDRVSTKLSSPVLVTADGNALCDSTEIARWASAQAAREQGGPGPLFPELAVLDLVEKLGVELGPHTRLAAYWHALQSEKVMRDLAANNVSRRQALAFRAVAPLGKQLIARALGVDAASYPRALDRVRATLAEIEDRPSRYLVGDCFTAADLTFAALLAPALLVTREEGYGATLPSLDDLASDARALVMELRATRAGKFALDVYRRHRKRRLA